MLVINCAAVLCNSVFFYCKDIVNLEKCASFDKHKETIENGGSC